MQGGIDNGSEWLGELSGKLQKRHGGVNGSDGSFGFASLNLLADLVLFNYHGEIGGELGGVWLGRRWQIAAVFVCLVGRWLMQGNVHGALLSL